MRKWIILLFTMLLFLPSAAQAQGGITLESLKVGLWSEYDQPSMLVIYDFEVTADTSLPVSLELRIPQNANITAVAFQQDGGLLNAEFAGPEEDGAWQTITIFVKERTTYHLEYYQPLTRTENNRAFEYQWLSTYPVNNFRVETRLPADSAAIKSTPVIPFTPDSSSLSGSASINDLAAGETFTLSLSYTRASDEPSFQAPSPISAEPITQDTAGRVTLDNLPYALGVVGVVLIAGAIYYFWQSNSNKPAGKTRRRSNRNDDLTQTYCHECGARASTEDRFCRVCGTKLRNK
jgi:ribosomal protein L40E